jgi:hypothetical protein
MSVVPMVALPFMIIVTNKPPTVEYIDQGIFIALWSIARFRDLKDSDFDNSSKLVHILGVEDQPSFRHRALDTISQLSVKRSG